MDQPTSPPSSRNSEPLPYEVPEKSWFASYWEKVGGGSLTISIILHAVLLVVALVWLVAKAVAPVPQETVNFLPGGGGGQGGEVKMQEKRQQRALRQTAPATRLVSAASSADAVTLPDVSSSLNMSQMSLSNPMMGGAAGAGAGSGSGGGRGSGTGTGVGSGFGPGSGAGFISVPSIFGSAGGTGLVGTLYDMKQDQDRKPLTYNGGVEEYFPKLYEIAEKRFRKDAFKEFYKAKITLNYTMLAVPNVAAEEGPKAFQADKEIQPRGWFVHYQGKIDPPQEGEWRFAGVFDDALLVYINNRLVFDGSYDSTSPPEVRQPFGQSTLGVTRPAFVGKWVRLRRGVNIDIIVGERPGGRVGGVLLVEQKTKRYKEREKDVPVLPVFAFNEPRPEDLERIRNIGIPIDEKTPIFKVNNDRFTSSLGGGDD